MKKILSLILSLALVFFLGGCNTGAPATTSSVSSTAEGAEGSTDDELIIGYVQNASDESMNTMADAFTAYCEKWNSEGKTPHITVRSVNAEGNIDKQIADIDSLIQMDCDVIASNAVDPTGIVPAIRRAREAGIKYVEMRGVSLEEIDVSFQGGEQVLAEIAIQWWHNYLDTHEDVVINAGIIYGMASSTNNLLRIDILLDDLKTNYPDRFSVVDYNYGDWDTTKAMEITENWLQAYSNMNCVITANGPMALGSVNAVAAVSGDMEEWIFTAYDSTADVLSMIGKGQLDMSVGLDLVKLGEEFAQLCIDTATGAFSEKIAMRSTNSYYALDASNIADYL